MGTASRTPLYALVTSTSLRGDLSLSRQELASTAGITRATLARLVRVGLIEPSGPPPTEFTAATAARLKRMLRLHDDLGVNLVGASIIADLLDRLERVEAELALRRGAS